MAIPEISDVRVPPQNLGLAKQYLLIFASNLQAILSRSSLAKSSTWVLLRLRFCSLRSTQSGLNLGANSGKVLFREPLKAEQSVLGAILLDNAALNRSMEFLSDEDFYRTANQMVYRSMVGLSERNQPVDQITLTAYHHKA